MNPLEHFDCGAHFMKGCVLSLLLVAFAWAAAAQTRTDVQLNTTLKGRYFLVVWGYQPPRR